MSMDVNTLQQNSFYHAICECIDGYVLVCDFPDNNYDSCNVVLTEDFIEEFNIPDNYSTNFFVEWIKRIHPEDVSAYKGGLRGMKWNSTDSFYAQYRVQDYDGNWIWMESTGHLSRDEQDNPVTFVGIIRNMGRKNQVDHITGLLNKYAFRENAKRNIDKNKRFGVLLLNIDDFRYINEQYSLDFGDRVLRSIGNYIQSRLNSNAAVYRMDGDEFGVIIDNPDPKDAEELYHRIANHYNSQKELQGKRYYCTFSATYYESEAGIEYQDMVKALKIGITVAKKQGNGHYMPFKSDFLRYKERELEIIEALRFSIENGFQGFELNFQPQVYADTKSLKGAEALLRWSDEKHGRVSPVEFIPLLEKTDMIHMVGKWVFEQAVEMCRKWVAFFPDFSMSINVSYLQLFDPDFVNFMKQCVQDAGIQYNNIIIEITESRFVSDKELLKRVFKSVREMGMKIAMDDFGTGYSSLGVLKEAPADIVKIDRIFVKDIRDNNFDSSFIKVVVELCHKVGIKVCLEGVELDEEMNIVSEMDLDFIQGYLYGKPENSDSFYEMYLKNQTN